MSATRNTHLTGSDMPADSTDRPTREEAEAAVRVLLRWAGDDPPPRRAARHAGARRAFL